MFLSNAIVEFFGLFNDVKNISYIPPEGIVTSSNVNLYKSGKLVNAFFVSDREYGA